MRFVLALLLLLAVLPAAAAAADGTSADPSPQDIAAQAPGIADDDAACMAAYYRGRLTRAGWAASWHTLTRAQKLVTYAGLTRCTTSEERVALQERSLGKVASPAQVSCMAREYERRPLAARLRVDSVAKAEASFDDMARPCGVIKEFYVLFARGMHMRPSEQEASCMARTGHVAAILRAPKSDKLAFASAARVLDRCLSRDDKLAMWSHSIPEDPELPQTAWQCIVSKMASGVTLEQLFRAGSVAQSPALRAKLDRIARHCALASI